MERDIVFERIQRGAGILEENMDAFTSLITPRNEKQRLLLNALERIEKTLKSKDREEKKEGVRALLVCGSEGRGKSWIISGLINKYLYNKYAATENTDGMAMYLTHYELDLRDKSCMNPKASKTQVEQYNDFCDVPLLVIDEIGRGSWSDYTAQNIENIISRRYSNLRPTILITNKTKAEIAKMFDRSILDRIANGKTGLVLDMDFAGSSSERR